MLAARLCDPWPLDGCCDFSALGISPAITGIAHVAASEFLWGATGRQFGNCAVELRPCRHDCQPATDPSSFPIPTTGWQYPFPELRDGEWINVACGGCSGACSCTSTSEVLFPDPVTVESVTLDGQALTTPGDWVLYENQRLVRVNGEWPLCQEWTITGGPGTFAVSVVVGADVPALGQLAVGKLTCELAKSCVGMQCELPPYTTSVSKNGATIATTIELLTKQGLTGILIPDLFIKSVNPKGYQDRARAYSPDVLPPRFR